MTKILKKILKVILEYRVTFANLIDIHVLQHFKDHGTMQCSVLIKNK